MPSGAVGPLIAFEALAGAAVLWRGRPRTVALTLLVAFNLTLVVFGWGFLIWAAPLTIALILLLRADAKRSHQLDDPAPEPTALCDVSVPPYWLPLGARRPSCSLERPDLRGARGAP